jgi:DNA repair exonuclease SbcCD ATPase subunit
VLKNNVKESTLKKIEFHINVLKMIDDDLISLYRKEENLNQQNIHDTNSLKTQKSSVIKDQKEIKAALKLDQDSLTTATSLLKNNEAKLLQVRAAVSKLVLEREDITNQRARRVAYLTSAKQQHSALEGVTGTCPTCFQKVSGQHQKTELARLDEVIKDLIIEIKHLTSLATEIKNEVVLEDKKITAIEVTIRNIRKNRDDFSTKITLKNSQLAEIASLIERIETALAEKDPKNEFTEMIADKLTAQKEQLEKLAKRKGKLQQLEEEKEALSFWSKGFKKIRLSIIDETLQQLEIEVNNNLAGLGLTDCRIEFDVERENKSGGISKGFVVLVHFTGADDAGLRFETYSGGEGQRLRLAGDLGLANLIMHRAGLESTIEFFDEPSDHLSPEGILDLAETLYNRAMASGKRILLIDHQNIDFDFTGRYVAVKDSSGSSLRHKD